MPTTDVRLRYIADIDAALAGMDSVEKSTRAQIKEVNRATSALRTYDRAQAAMAGTARMKVVPSLGATRAATGNLQAQIFDIGAGLQGGQNPLTILAQQGPQVAQAMAGAGGGIAALKAALISTAAIVGPVVVVVGTLVAAWKAYGEEQDLANESAQNAATLQGHLSDIIDDTRAKTIDLAEATGELGATEARRWRESTAALKRWQSATSESSTKLAELREKQASVTTQVVDSALALSDWIPTGVVTNKLIDGLTTDSGELAQQIQDLQIKVNDSTSALRDNATVTHAASEATAKATASKRSSTAASKERKEALRAEASAQQKVLDGLLAQEQASASLTKIASAAAATGLSDDEKIDSALRARLITIGELEKASGDHAQAEAARQAVLAQAERDHADVATELAKKAADEAEKAAAKEVAARKKVTAAYESSISGLTSSISSYYAVEAQESAEGFERYKKAQLAEATIAGAAAVAKAFATVPFPVSLGVAALVGTATGIQIATIAQQSYSDTPGLVRAGAQGLSATFAPGDLVVAGRDNADLVRQMQRAGLGGGGASTQVVVREADRNRGRYGRDPMRPPDRYERIRKRAGRIPGRSS